MNFVNLTNNELKELNSGITIEPSGTIAYASRNSKKIDTIDSIPVYQDNMGDISNLPEPKDGTVYIVSALALKSVPNHRTDVVAPGNLVRDNSGKPIGCHGFRR